MEARVFPRNNKNTRREGELTAGLTSDKQKLLWPLLLRLLPFFPGHVGLG
jgi:hypothetical protein